MIGLSDKEIEILLLLTKDLYTDYNANNITKKLDITPAGAFKAMKNLEKKGLITSKKMGKAVFYKINHEDYYAFRVVETLLIGEARQKASRWISEFHDLYKHVEIALIFGSIMRTPQKANDIDLLVVLKEDNYDAMRQVIERRRRLVTKPIHLIKQTPTDLLKNLRTKDKVLQNALQYGYVLYGYEQLLKVIMDVASF
ncbi:hypothetical protein HYW21_06385 [Candidatus Woesearchaeota archaeon]|nr:hypothetical protein [Candidatus Woesearchaeota archaeon]